MSTSNLIHLSGLTAVLSGILLILGAIILNAVSETAVFYNSIFFAAHVLFVFALTGIYARQTQATGILGLAGYVVTMIGNLFFAALLAVSAYVIPNIEGTWVLGAVAISSPLDNIGIPLTLLLLVVGLLLFAIANMRAGILPRWAGWLMFGGTLLNPALQAANAATIVASMAPLFLALGLLRMGVALWAGERVTAVQPEPITQI